MVIYTQTSARGQLHDIISQCPHAVALVPLPLLRTTSGPSSAIVVCPTPKGPPRKRKLKARRKHPSHSPLSFPTLSNYLNKLRNAQSPASRERGEYSAKASAAIFNDCVCTRSCYMWRQHRLSHSFPGTDQCTLQPKWSCFNTQFSSSFYPESLFRQLVNEYLHWSNEVSHLKIPLPDHSYTFNELRGRTHFTEAKMWRCETILRQVHGLLHSSFSTSLTFFDPQDTAPISPLSISDAQQQSKLGR